MSTGHQQTVRRGQTARPSEAEALFEELHADIDAGGEPADAEQRGQIPRGKPEDHLDGTSDEHGAPDDQEHAHEISEQRRASAR